MQYRNKNMWVQHHSSGTYLLKIEHEKINLWKILYHHWLVVFQVEDDEKLNDLSQSSDQVSARPYLCTGYDIFLVWEPCAM